MVYAGGGQLIQKVARTNPIELNGDTIHDRHGKKYTLRVQRRPVEGWAETYLHGMQPPHKTYLKFTVMDGDVPAATIGLIKLGKHRIRSVSGEVDPRYTGRDLFGRLCDKAYSQFPRLTELQGGVGSIETLVALIEAPPIKGFVHDLSASKKERLAKIAEKARRLRREYGRVDFGHHPNQRATKSRVGYAEWKLLCETVADATDSGMHVPDEIISRTLLGRSFTYGFHDFRLSHVRTTRTDDGSKFVLPILTASKWKS